MIRLFTIVALIAAVFSVVLSVLPVSNLAIFPAITSLLFGLLAHYLSKKRGTVKKIIQFIFLLTIIALVVTTYKAIFTVTEVTDTKELKAKETESKKEAIEDLEDLDLDDVSVD